MARNNRTRRLGGRGALHSLLRQPGLAEGFDVSVQALLFPLAGESFFQTFERKFRIFFMTIFAYL
jgi:hypothetical protein